MTRRRPADPQALEQDIRRAIRATAGLRNELDDLLKEVLESRDAGLVSLRSKLGVIGGTGTGDPTQASAASLEFQRLQDVMRFVSRRVERVGSHISSARANVRDARGEEDPQVRRQPGRGVREVGGIIGAWLDIDPEEGPARRERREAARELRKAEPAPKAPVLRCPTCGAPQPVVVRRTPTTSG